VFLQILIHCAYFDMFKMSYWKGLPLGIWYCWSWLVYRLEATQDCHSALKTVW